MVYSEIHDLKIIVKNILLNVKFILHLVKISLQL